jgi:hypothetical protein
MTHVAKIERSELARALGVSASELFDGIDGRDALRDQQDRL